jgi:hypothetical protein
MDVPSLETPEGLFDWLIALIVVLAAAIGVFIVVVGGVPL